MTSRRAFVAGGSRALAGLTVMRRWPAAVRTVPASTLRGEASAATLCAEEMAPLDLAGLGARALDAAKSAGASFADIRLAEQYNLDIDAMFGPSQLLFGLTSQFSYGIRVIVNGAMAFVHGCAPDGDRIAAAARDAAATARALAMLAPSPIELAPAPVARGAWVTPIQYDPFVVPLQDQADRLNSYWTLGQRPLAAMGVVLGFRWTKEHRVYGSTEGALTTQTLYRAWPDGWISGARTLLSSAEAFPPRLTVPTSGGYETVLGPDLPDRVIALAEKVSEISRMPERRIEVGRYPVVVDGSVLGLLFGQTVGTALELDRALGHESDTTGTSFLAPPTDVLGKQMINPLLNVTASRVLPHVQAVKWDDDGVEPEEYRILKDGIVVDYHTSRQTASALAAWYHAQGRPMRSHGCAVASEASEPVVVRIPHLTVAPGESQTSLEDLYQGMSHGLLLTQRPLVSMDQKLTSGAVSYMELFEVIHGKIVGRVKDAGLQFQTLPLWKSLTAIGDARTVCDTAYDEIKGMQWRTDRNTVSAPAGFFSRVNIVNTGRVV